jgi:hypothetical protein
MKIRILLLMIVVSLCAISTNLRAQGTAFTYQGSLNDGTNIANGAYDLSFQLYDNATGGALLAGPLTNLDTRVSNGLFTVTIDFGDVFNGTVVWLQMGVRTNGATNFVTLSPRLELTPTPYAIFAEGANASGLTGTIPMASLNGAYNAVLDLTNAGNSFAGNGAGLSNVNATALGGVASSSFWKLGGNIAGSGAFIGTLNNEDMDFKVNNVRALRLRLATDSLGLFNDAPDIVMGSAVNFITAGFVGATISGGGGMDTSTNSYVNNVGADFGTVGGGMGNTASGPGSFVGGGGFDGYLADGVGNTASGGASVVGGGVRNNNSSFAGTIGGGILNSANSTTGGFFSGGATVAGGSGNNASTDQATVGGGYGNKATALGATVPGGLDNAAGGTGSFAAGQYAQTTNNDTFVWGDGSQIPFTGAGFDDAFNVLASGGVLFFNGSEGVHVDYLNQNSGAIAYGLRFGAGASGEGLASQRTVAGSNQYGLDFYTSSANRMSIANGGFVGINTSSPSERLEVNGNYILIDGGNADDKNGPIDAYIGGNGSGSDVQIGSQNSLITTVGFWNTSAGAWMHIACSSITINGGADLAEPFEISTANEEMPAGSVVVIDAEHPGQLKLSSQPYDTCVAGVLSGANGINPGIQMQQQALLRGGKNVALTGRVYVQADASTGAIHPGDLLTTSSTPGHAMKVTDHAKAQGAILGKAMSALSEGKGMVLVLVTLQ